MTTALAEIQEEFALSPAPAAQFQRLSTARQQEVFVQQFETVQQTIVADMNTDQLHHQSRPQK